jgi:hypothetical protein
VLTRLAVALVIICIGVMLLSACGIPLRYNHPIALASQTFSIWEIKPDSPAENLGSGTVFGDAENFKLRMTLRAPLCSLYTWPTLTGRLSGNLSANPPYRWTASSRDGDLVFWGDTTGSAPTHPISVIPAAGTLSVYSCNRTLQLEFRPAGQATPQSP